LADGGLPIEPRCWPKGSTWVLDANDGQVTGARYLAPLRLAAPSAHEACDLRKREPGDPEAAR